MSDKSSQRFGITLWQMPLWLVIVLPFVVLIATAMGLTAWVSLYHGRNAVDELAVELNQRITDTITKHVAAFTETPMRFVQVVSAPYRTGNREPTDYQELRKSLLGQLKFTMSLDALYYGNQHGHFVLVKSPEQGLAFLRDENTGDNRQIFRIDAEGNHVEHVETQPYDPRQRPWYRSAVEVGVPTWSPVYLFAADAVLGVSPVVPLHDGNGDLRGVFAADLTLNDIAIFLRGLDISSNGQAFIIERSGNVVATSSAEQPFIQGESGRERLFIGNSKNALLRSISQAMDAEFGGFERIGSHKRLTYDVADESYFVQVTEMQENGLDWLLVVAIPSSDFMGPINASTRFAEICVVLALIAAVVLGAVTARGINRSIARLGDASKAVASGQLDHEVELNSVPEMRALGHSFNEMTEQVRSSIRRLEKANEQLEGQVAQGSVSLEEQREREHLLTGELDAANRQLEVLAITDAVTGLANHRRFATHLARLWAQCVRDEAPLAIVLVEISTGSAESVDEERLIEFSSSLEQVAMRPSDLVARCGVEEFAFVLPATNLDGATNVARGAVERLQRMNADHEGGALRYCLGIACVRPSRTTQPELLVQMTRSAAANARQRGPDKLVRIGEDGNAQEV